MIGDKIAYHAAYKPVTDFVINKLKDKLNKRQRICISVGGESGCGKTSLTYALLKDIEATTNLRGFIFHADDYYVLPPRDTHNLRIEDFSRVGTNEVKLNLLEININEFKNGNTDILKPLIVYDENVILEERINSMDFDFCLVEGTYAMLLENSDYKVFMDITYEDTRPVRIQRARDIIGGIAEKVLEIEHEIVKTHKVLADVVIDKNIKIIN
ncbi:hypothetical protein [Yeosuana marina]|uniref:hypothetical protein n=1 Tax=Yeosuana marina TaxID=1565536 RepID=UPI0030EC16EB|tara:strand:- start:1164 stop:1802 length:639 start_codon:yes stop_codon:yes gene_type:complete